jgi:ribosomal protein L35
MKTNKSFSKRIKKTKSGKLLARKIGQGHFNAKTTGAKRSKKGNMVEITMTNKSIGRFLK